MAQKPITNRIEFGQNLNPLKDYPLLVYRQLMMMEIFKHLSMKLIK